MIVTIGGASVGDHDLVGTGAGGARHGAGVLEDRHAAGQTADVRPPRARPACWALPGNPVSAIVCSRVFLVPLIRALLGRPDQRPGLRPARAGRSARSQRPAPATTCARPPRTGARRPARGHPGALAGQFPAGTAGAGRLPAGSTRQRAGGASRLPSYRSCRSIFELYPGMASEAAAWVLPLAEQEANNLRCSRFVR